MISNACKATQTPVCLSDSILGFFCPQVWQQLDAVHASGLRMTLHRLAFSFMCLDAKSASPIVQKLAEEAAGPAANRWVLVTLQWLVVISHACKCVACPSRLLVCSDIRANQVCASSDCRITVKCSQSTLHIIFNLPHAAYIVTSTTRYFVKLCTMTSVLQLLD